MNDWSDDVEARRKLVEWLEFSLFTWLVLGFIALIVAVSLGAGWWSMLSFAPMGLAWLCLLYWSRR